MGEIEQLAAHFGNILIKMSMFAGVYKLLVIPLAIISARNPGGFIEISPTIYQVASVLHRSPDVNLT